MGAAAEDLSAGEDEKRSALRVGGVGVYDEPRFLEAGEGCLVVEFSDGIERAANMKLQSLRRFLEGKNVRGVREYVPTFRSLSVYYDPLWISGKKLEETIVHGLDSMKDAKAPFRRVLVMPVAYGGEYGPDMKNVSEHTGFDEDEIVRRHTANDYYCFMIGFTPGFGYLGGLDESLATPRLASPRILIPAGSVGIADKQTGVYSIDSPGGWRLIGRTPLRLFNPDDEETPTLLEAGDWLRFRPISGNEFERIASEVAAHRYVPERFHEEGGE